MPATSKAQFRFMKYLETTKGKRKKGQMSSKQAEEYTKENKGKMSYKNLPEKK